MLYDFDLNEFVTGDFDGDGDFDATNMVCSVNAIHC